MPKNGFFFLFMAPVTPKAKNVKDPGRSQKRNSTKLLPPQEAIATCVTRALFGDRNHKFPFMPRPPGSQAVLPSLGTKGDSVPCRPPAPPHHPRLPGPVPPSRQPWGDPALVPQRLTQGPRQRDPAAVERGEDQQHGRHVEDDVSEEGPGGRCEGTQDGDPTGHHGGDQHARACGRGGQARSAPRPPPAALPAPSPAAGAARSYQTGPQRPGQLCAGPRRPPGR